MALPQTLERWTERHDVGHDVARERSENKRTHRDGYCAPWRRQPDRGVAGIAVYLISIRLVTSVTPGRLATSSPAATISDWSLT